jgi:hypothetical protein
VIPWLIFAVVVVPLVVIGFAATRRRTAAGERPASGDQGLTDEELAAEEAYEAEWREKDKEHYREERLP